jgi:hypothetical protein
MGWLRKSSISRRLVGGVAATTSRPEAAGADGESPEVLYVLANTENENRDVGAGSWSPTPDAWCAGWTLSALRGPRCSWSMSLAGRGAAATAPPRVAKAVALRVLAEQGVPVVAWAGSGGGDQPIFRALLDGHRPASGTSRRRGGPCVESRPLDRSPLTPSV